MGGGGSSENMALAKVPQALHLSDIWRLSSLHLTRLSRIDL